MASLNEVLHRLERLPAVPIAVTELIANLCGSDDSPSESAKDIVSRDAALSAAVLRVANSAALGFHVPATSIQEALGRVGEKQLLKIALAHASEETLGGAVPEYGLAPGQAWEGALAGALAAEFLASRTQVADPNVAFTAALLRDIGKLVMGLIVEGGAIERALLQRGAEDDVLSVERADLGFDHAQVGAALGRAWSLPDQLVDAIRYHHDPPDDPDLVEPLHHVVHCADGVAVLLGYGVGDDGLGYRVRDDSRAILGLDRELLEEAILAVRLRIDEFLLGLDAIGRA